MSAAQIRFATLWRREVNRFMKIKKQTLGAPLLETFLYITVFGAALGSRIKELHGIEYILFVIPGLIMMAFSTNAFANNSSSILQQKFQGAIQDQLSSPASPTGAAARLQPRRLRARAAGRGARLRRLGDPRRPAGRTRPRPDSRPLPGRLLLLAAGGADRRPGRTVRRRRLRPDLRPPAADLPRRRLLLGGAAAAAVRDADPLQPDLLHDQPGPLRIRRLTAKSASRSRCSP